MTFSIISTSDTMSAELGSYKRQFQQIGPYCYGLWNGFATVRNGVLSPSLNIVTPAKVKGWADQTALTLPAGAFICSVSMKTEGPLTIAAATGKLKFAATLTAATSTLYVESAAASGGVLATQTVPVSTFNVTPVSGGGSALTYSIFATDGGAGGAAAASTVTAAVETRILVTIGVMIPAPFPTNLEVGYSVPPVVNEYGV